MADSNRTRKDPPNVDGMFTLKVDNIPFQATIESLTELFEKYGEVGDVYIPRHFGSTEPKGFAFVRFAKQADGEDAMESLNGKEIDGRNLRVQVARQKRQLTIS